MDPYLPTESKLIILMLYALLTLILDINVMENILRRVHTEPSALTVQKQYSSTEAPPFMLVHVH